MSYRSDASGHIDVATSASDGTAFVPFAPQPCHQLTIVNNTGTDIEVQQGGAGDAFPVLNGSPFVFCGITDASQLAVRRIDQGGTVTVQARWEA